jgi:hypothetical protein
MFPVYGGKCLSRKVVHNCVKKRGKRFADDEEVKTEVWTWLRKQSRDFYAAGFDVLVKRWGKCIMLMEDMPRNKRFSQIRISHVLLFISICDLFNDSRSLCMRYMDGEMGWIWVFYFKVLSRNFCQDSSVTMSKSPDRESISRLLK